MDPLFVPAFVSNTRSFAPEEVILPAAEPLPITTSPVPPLVNATLPLPLVAKVIAPFAASVIVMDPELVPAFVSRTKSFAPEVVIFPAADPLPTTTSPVPLLTRLMFPLAASVMGMDELLVPVFVLKFY